MAAAWPRMFTHTTGLSTTSTTALARPRPPPSSCSTTSRPMWAPAPRLNCAPKAVLSAAWARPSAWSTRASCEGLNQPAFERRSVGHAQAPGAHPRVVGRWHHQGQAQQLLSARHQCGAAFGSTQVQAQVIDFLQAPCAGALAFAGMQFNADPFVAWGHARALGSAVGEHKFQLHTWAFAHPQTQAPHGFHGFQGHEESTE